MNFEKCYACGQPYKSNASKFCSTCGAARTTSKPPQGNHCTNPKCPNSQIVLGETECYCDLCGSVTTPYGEKVAEALGH